MTELLLKRKTFADRRIEPQDIILGTIGDDALTGTQGGDIITGLLGNDLLKGKNGDDLLDGDELGLPLLGGSDTLKGGTGDDTLLGGAGNDELRGNKGADEMRGTWADYAVSEQPVAVICEIRDRAATLLRDNGYLAAVQVPTEMICTPFRIPTMSGKMGSA